MKFMTIKQKLGEFIVRQMEKRGLTVVELAPIPRPFRTHGLATFWHDRGCPDKVGDEIKVKMVSGQTAVFKLTNIEPATGVDWSWYDFGFVRYL